MDPFARLHALAMELKRFPGLQPSLDAIVAALVELHGAESGSLSLYDRTSGTLRCASEFWLGGPVKPDAVQPGPDHGGTSSAFLTRRRTVTSDTESDPRFAGTRETARIAGIRTVHDTPVVSSIGEVLGVLSVHFGEPRTPLEWETQFADLCAQHAAEVVERARLHGEIQAAERRRQESDLHVTTLLDAVPAGVYACDLQGRLTFFNRRAAEIWGREPKLGADDTKFCGALRLRRQNGMLLPHEETPMARALATGEEAQNQEIGIERPDGSQITVSVNVRTLTDATGRRFGAINVFEDVTEPKAALEALAISRRAERARLQELEALMHAAPAAIMISHGGIGSITGNAAAYRLLRVPPGGNLSKSAPGDTAPTSFEVHQGGQLLRTDQLPMQVAAKTGRPVTNQELEWRYPDGSSTWVYGSAIPLVDELGEVETVLAAFVDITELKLAERDLRESEGRFRRMADCSPVMMRLMAPDGRCAYVNPLWCAFTGQEVHAGLEYGWLDAVHPEDREAARNGFLKAALDRGAFRLEYRLRRADGAWRWVISAGAPRLSESGELLGFVSSVIDISERKEMEDAIRSANADLQQFAYAAAHDLQEPLRNVIIYSQLLGDTFQHRLDGEALQFLNFTTQGALRMQMLVDDLLAYTRLSATEAAPGPVDTAAVLEEVKATLEPAIRDSGATIEALQLPTLTAHRGRVSQLFQNLLSNAIKYRAPDLRPHIVVRAAKCEGSYLFSIADNGLGIEPEYHELAFKIFKRLHPSVPGTGIGLAICRRIVEGYRGKIWIESKGQSTGCTVLFTLPS